MAESPRASMPRRTSSVPPEFAPLGAASEQPARRPSGDPPRLRLTSAATRRNVPDRPAAHVPVPAPAPVTVSEPTPVLGSSDGQTRSRAPILSAGCVLLVALGALLVLRLSGDGVAPTVTSAVDRKPDATTNPFDPPVTLGADSEYVETRALEGGDLLVTHWISSSRPMGRFRLRTPTSPGLDGVGVDVRDLVVAADGATLADVSGVGVDRPARLAGARSLYLRYRLAGALDLRASVDGRALAAVTALGVGLEGRSLARTQVFPGGKVMTLACLGQGVRAVPEVCGTYEEGAWQVRSEAGALPVSVIAQLDLSVTR